MKLNFYRDGDLLLVSMDAGKARGRVWCKYSTTAVMSLDYLEQNILVVYR